MSLVSLTLPSNGQSIEAEDVNVPFNALANVINGNIDNTNISASGISGTKIQTGTLPGSALDATAKQGWQDLGAVPNTVTYLGNHSYSAVFNGVDLTGVLSNGSKLKFTKNTPAPTQCTSLNGTNQNFVKTSPVGMTFTDDFVAGGWIKLLSYPATADAGIIGRYSNATGGWYMSVTNTGQIQLAGFATSSANASLIKSIQSIPLNKWVYLAAQLDMSSYTTTPTTSYIMIDGVDVQASLNRFGTNPTALTQGGNFEVGSYGAANFLNAKLEQVFVTNAKVAQATIQSYYSQGFSGSEPSLVSAYSFNNSINDLNTTNANNLTPSNGATATNTDSPFGLDDNNVPSALVSFGVVTSKVFSTNTTITFQVPEGCTVPNGIASVAYSGQAQPFGFPRQDVRWTISSEYIVGLSSSFGAGLAQFAQVQLLTPTGSWNLGYQGTVVATGNSSPFFDVSISTSTSAKDDVTMDSGGQVQVNGVGYYTSVGKQKPVSLVTATNYYFVRTGGANLTSMGSTGGLKLYAKLSYS